MNRFLFILSILSFSLGTTAQQSFPGNLRPQWLDSAVIYEVNLRQFTASGTFKDFGAHLPRLQKMGVNVLWLMPVHPVSRLHRKGSLGSPYSVATYSEVNPEFGTNEDFRLMVQQARQLGMKVILDWVPNHTGWSHMWIKKHPDWYVRDPLTDTIMHPMGTDWHDVADLNFDIPELRIEMIRSLLHWIDAYSIDGFHFDKAMMVPEEFWLQFGKILRQLNKSILLIGESNEARWLESGLFHVDYSWTFMQLMREVAMGVKSAADLRYFF
ncbi:MAG TPA: alpha-amylase family glycosyl hydrolase, partial [Saprospiraceae bacterium]|nr:alpha-amylase family glycosyl hydrolase [Saprospiraceae bacterium]